MFDTFYMRINSHLTTSGVTNDTIKEAREYALNHPDADENRGCAHTMLSSNDVVIPFSEIRGKNNV